MAENPTRNFTDVEQVLMTEISSVAEKKEIADRYQGQWYLCADMWNGKLQYSKSTIPPSYKKHEKPLGKRVISYDLTSAQAGLQIDDLVVLAEAGKLNPWRATTVAPKVSASCWKSLGLEEGATRKEITTRFHELAKKHHPDIEGGDHNFFIRIRRAYEQAMRLVPEDK
jgi:hypothetical protein